LGGGCSVEHRPPPTAAVLDSLATMYLQDQNTSEQLLQLRDSLFACGRGKGGRAAFEECQPYHSQLDTLFARRGVHADTWWSDRDTVVFVSVWQDADHDSFYYAGYLLTPRRLAVPSLLDSYEYGPEGSPVLARVVRLLEPSSYLFWGSAVNRLAGD
jgi:hypothetical protein